MSEEEINYTQKLFEPYKVNAAREIFNIVSEYEKEYPPTSGFPSTRSFAYTKEILKGGKRFRYTAAVASYQAVTRDYDFSVIGRPAVWVELFHPYTLWLDDVMDEEKLRRKVDSAWFAASKLYEYPDAKKPAEIFIDKSTRYGVSIGGILDGVILFSLAFRAVRTSNLSQEKVNSITNIINDANLRLAWGQKQDIDLEKVEKTVERYKIMSADKTAFLYKCAVETGVLIGDGTDAQRRALSDYARKMAEVFQDRDDILGAGLVSVDTGKSDDSDIRKGKTTKLCIYAEENASQSQLNFLNEHYGNIPSHSPRKEQDKIINRIRSILIETALDKVQKEDERLVRESIDDLRSVNLDLPARRVLENLSKYQLVRKD